MIFSSILTRADDVASTALAEMSGGKTKIFNTATVKKSLVNFEIIYPESWQVSEPASPSVIALIDDTNHLRTANFVITENRSPATTNLTTDQIFSGPFFKNFIRDNAILVRVERYKEGMFDGAILEYILKKSRGTLNFRLFVSNYTFAKDGVLVQLQFYVFLDEKEDKQVDDAKIAAFKPLWTAMLRTLKFQP